MLRRSQPIDTVQGWLSGSFPGLVILHPPAGSVQNRQSRTSKKIFLLDTVKGASPCSVRSGPRIFITAEVENPPSSWKRCASSLLGWVLVSSETGKGWGGCRPGTEIDGALQCDKTENLFKKKKKKASILMTLK